ncbi:unnamed protein product [Larinioides sclopetarius]|uniref:Uncharacterized protein n=1 Tax=Larinioides sclopetarius TaxID=280406 RepID=A0AAV1Z5D0_9ARAC
MSVPYHKNQGPVSDTTECGTMTDPIIFANPSCMEDAKGMETDSRKEPIAKLPVSRRSSKVRIFI